MLPEFPKAEGESAKLVYVAGADCFRGEEKETDDMY